MNTGYLYSGDMSAWSEDDWREHSAHKYLEKKQNERYEKTINFRLRNLISKLKTKKACLKNLDLNSIPF